MKNGKRRPLSDQAKRIVAREAAEVLLDTGVSVPLKEIRIPFRKKALQWRVTMRRPTLGGQMRIARLYLSMGVTAAELRGLDKEGQMRFVAEHGVAVSRMVAVTLCRGWWRRKLLERPVAWVLRQFMEPRYLTGALTQYVLLMGTEGFMSIIRSAETVNPMKPRLSRERMGS